MALKAKLSLGLIALIAIFFNGSSLHAEEQKVYTLEDSLSEAFANNWSIQAKKERVDGARYAEKQARADFFPKLNTSYSYLRQSEKRLFRAPIPGLSSVPLSSLNNYRWSGGISQPLFRGFALVSTHDLAKLGIDLSETEVELEKLDLALNVKEAYFNILKADKAVEVAEKAVEALDSHVKVAQSFYDVGMIPINDLLKAEVQLGNAQHDLVVAENGAKLARASFNNVLSRRVDAPVMLVDITAYEPEAGNFDTYLENALENRPEIKVVDINIEQTDQKKRLAASKYYPEVGLTYDYIKEGNQLDVAGSDFHDAGRWEAQAVLSWTFWEWGKTRSAIREQESFKKELMKTRLSLEDQIGLQIKEAVLNIEQEEKNIPTARKAVEQGEENLRVSRERYKAQVTTSTEVLDAQTLLTEARVNYFRALYDRNLAKARLLRAMGEY